ncbi:response regulator [Sediminibacterium ginsengisoli]|uniref:CheY chemotaxis protein or a CheY-like REC (Receiver) domain n=1 Tax=Sediminibacterium ginsengisoli TaxID=413434 RepID=A0A1T4P7T6_9BACT|nr:response regulator [Sediminibacterium ginsengisoli]SJZ87635.1 CheY chemotaxis protein or a CheY-like REC (receiver) domain [Sediminibacterium ginsengisoli]
MNENYTILIVDDDAEDRGFMLEAMKELGAADLIGFAEDGEKALTILQRRAKQGNLPKLVVMDLNMPKLNGTQTIELLKQDVELAQIPVMILSTSINRFEQEKALSLGVHSYLIKPFTFLEAIETARGFIGFVS